MRKGMCGGREQRPGWPLVTIFARRSVGGGAASEHLQRARAPRKWDKKKWKKQEVGRRVRVEARGDSTDTHTHGHVWANESAGRTKRR